MIPSVTVSSNPTGFPIATTKSPAWTESESPNFNGFSPGSSTLSTAKSTTASAPISFAFFVRPSLSCTSISSTWSTT